MITFTTGLPETTVLNAFNNNVVEYYSDHSSTAIKSVITLLGKDFEITPNTNGVFHFNFKELVKRLINENYFRDTIEPDVNLSFVYEDQTVYREIQVEYKIEFVDATFETTIKNYKFLKSVEQLENFRKNLVNTENTKLSILTPFRDSSSKTYFSTYFFGYPFDVSIYSDQIRTITIENKNTQLSTTIDLTKGVNRLYLSDGDHFSFENLLPLYYGINELEFRINTNEHITLFLKKVESKCGVYLKWFNNEGGWNYFLFDSSKSKRRVKSIGVLDNDFENMIDTKESEIQMGVNSSDSLKMYANRLHEYEKEIINGLSESPKIYKYLNSMFQKFKKTDWINTSIASKNMDLMDSQKKKYRVSVELNKTKRNTMTL
jgi:hypothetical protein